VPLVAVDTSRSEPSLAFVACQSGARMRRPTCSGLPASDPPPTPPLGAIIKTASKNSPHRHAVVVHPRPARAVPRDGVKNAITRRVNVQRRRLQRGLRGEGDSLRFERRPNDGVAGLRCRRVEPHGRVPPRWRAGGLKSNDGLVCLEVGVDVGGDAAAADGLRPREEGGGAPVPFAKSVRRDRGGCV
jgi:hypothetical protein